MSQIMLLITSALASMPPLPPVLPAQWLTCGSHTGAPLAPRATGSTPASRPSQNRHVNRPLNREATFIREPRETSSESTRDMADYGSGDRECVRLLSGEPWTGISRRTDNHSHHPPTPKQGRLPF